jgi:hypothetical protein
MGNLRHARTYQVDGTRDHLRAQAYGDRALIVLVRVMSHQGRREGRLQGEAAQVGVVFGGKSTRCAYSEPTEYLCWRAT